MKTLLGIFALLFTSISFAGENSISITNTDSYEVPVVEIGARGEFKTVTQYADVEISCNKRNYVVGTIGSQGFPGKPQFARAEKFPLTFHINDMSERFKYHTLKKCLVATLEDVEVLVPIRFEVEGTCRNDTIFRRFPPIRHDKVRDRKVINAKLDCSKLIQALP